jgi:hypothetical protein
LSLSLLICVLIFKLVQEIVTIRYNRSVGLIIGAEWRDNSVFISHDLNFEAELGRACEVISQCSMDLLRSLILSRLNFQIIFGKFVPGV